MGAYDYWYEQKQKLQQSVTDSTKQSDVVYAVRHSLAQVEQNTMAEQADDLLRQQTGILFSCCKTSTNLLDVSMISNVWVPESRQRKVKNALRLTLWRAAGITLGAAGLYCYAKDLWVAWSLIALGLGFGVSAMVRAAKKRMAEDPQDRTMVTIQPDLEKLFRAIDVQMRAIDRYINDFAYLNGKSEVGENFPDGKMIIRIANMLEALYECDDGAMDAVENATGLMLDDMGLKAIQYHENSKHLFTILPSKSQTRTMIPAIVASGDHRLLFRGLAVAQDADTAMEAMESTR